MDCSTLETETSFAFSFHNKAINLILMRVRSSCVPSLNLVKMKPNAHAMQFVAPERLFSKNLRRFSVSFVNTHLMASTSPNSIEQSRCIYLSDFSLGEILRLVHRVCGDLQMIIGRLLIARCCIKNAIITLSQFVPLAVSCLMPACHTFVSSQARRIYIEFLRLLAFFGVRLNHICRVKVPTRGSRC